MADTFAKRVVVNAKRGRGKVILSQGIAPAVKILPDVGLASLLRDPDPMIANHFELIMLKGTIISAYVKTYDSGKVGLVATPCIGAAGCEWVQPVLTTATGAVELADLGTAAGAGEALLSPVLVPDRADAAKASKAKPLGVLLVDAYRPFEYGENEGVTFTTHGYVEWPTTKKVVPGDPATVLFDNTDLAVGDYIKPDALGRPVKWVAGVDPDFLRIGRVVEKETIGSDFDYALLNYFQLPQTPDGLTEDIVKTVFTVNAINTSTNAVTEVFGVRPNVDGLLTLVDPATAVAGATGCVRVQLLNL